MDPRNWNVFIEASDGKQAIAHYDHFVVGHGDERYKLKSLGRYRGTAGDSLHRQLGARFSIYDSDSDSSNNSNCAFDRKGGFWFEDYSGA